MARGKTNWAVLALLFAFGGRRRDATAADAPAPGPTLRYTRGDPGLEVEARRTGPTGPHARDEWIASRLSAVYEELERVLRLPAEIMERVGRAFVSLWAAETGWGSGEQNYNVGNVTAFAWRGRPWHALPDGGHFRAYDSLASAVQDFVRLMFGSGYRAATGQLLLNPDDMAAWSGQLLAAHYSEPRPGLDRAAWAAEHARTLEGVRRRLDAWIAARAERERRAAN